MPQAAARTASLHRDATDPTAAGAASTAPAPVAQSGVSLWRRAPDGLSEPRPGPAVCSAPVAATPRGQSPASGALAPGLGSAGPAARRRAGPGRVGSCVGLFCRRAPPGQALLRQRPRQPRASCSFHVHPQPRSTRTEAKGRGVPGGHGRCPVPGADSPGVSAAGPGPGG